MRFLCLKHALLRLTGTREDIVRQIKGLLAEPGMAGLVGAAGAGASEAASEDSQNKLDAAQVTSALPLIVQALRL